VVSVDGPEMAGDGLLALDAPNNALSPLPNTGFAM
ncbi:MAG: hypothetical protein JWM04_1066, partial [Verrucomicrobiales bacterium]|nr:hypothetical protein [Verrucomicrobiales bacterium]